MAGADQYPPQAVRCPDCRAAPGSACVSLTPKTRRQVMHTPHSSRLTAARTAWQRAGGPRIPATVSDAWTCPAEDCGRSYWPPQGWEPELWPAVRRAAQELHRELHAASHRRRSRRRAAGSAASGL